MKKFCVSFDVEANDGDEAIKKANEKIVKAIKENSAIGDIVKVEESLPEIDCWKIVMTTEGGEKIPFQEDIPLELSKRIDEMIEEFYPVSWMS